MQLRRNRAGKFEGMAAALRPLRLPGFPNLGLAYLVNEFGNWLGEIALAILVFDQTGSPMATAALFCGMHFAPAVLGPPLVARLESAPVRYSLPGLYAAEAVAFADGVAFVDAPTRPGAAGAVRGEKDATGDALNDSSDGEGSA